MLLWPVHQALFDPLDTILNDPALKGAHVGVCVTDSKGKVLFERDSELRFVPASNQKVVTCLFALESLGPEWRGKTQVWKKEKSVVVRSSGDPSLTLSELRSVRKNLKLNQNRPVFIQVPFKPTLGPGWEWDDLPWYYAAATSLIAADHASFEVWASNGRIEQLAPELQVKIVRGSGSEPETEFDPVTNTLTVRGHVPSSRKSLGRFAQSKPLATVARALGGDLSTKKTDIPDRVPDAEIVGQSLIVMAKDCLEESDNVMAEQFLILAAMKTSGQPDMSYSLAAKTEREWLSKRSGVSLEGFRPHDGSGLSRHNQISPRSLCGLLDWALTRPYRERWLSALAAPGEGTLKNRLKESSFIGKTGTMDAVVSLCGYVKTRNGETLTLSFLVNNSLAPASEVRSVQDRFVRALENGSIPDEQLPPTVKDPPGTVPESGDRLAPRYRFYRSR